MFESIFKDYEINMLKANNYLESAIDLFNTNLIENRNLIQEGYIDSFEDINDIYNESTNTIKDRIKEFFNKIKDAFSRLVISIKNSIKAQITKRKANKKLADIKKQFVANKKLAATAKGKKVSYFDSIKYSRVYTKFINNTISDFSKICSKKYNNAQEYVDAYSNFVKKMTDNERKLQLNGEEAWKTTATLFDLVNKAEFEMKSYDDVMKQLNDFYIVTVDKLKDIAMKEDDTNKIQHIKNISNKLSSKFSSAVKKVGKSPITIIALVVSELAFVAKAYPKIYNAGLKVGDNRNAYKQGTDKGFKDGYNTNLPKTSKSIYAKGYADGVARRNGPAIPGTTSRPLIG